MKILNKTYVRVKINPTSSNRFQTKINGRLPPKTNLEHAQSEASSSSLGIYGSWRCFTATCWM